MVYRSDSLVMTPVWRLQNGMGPTWAYAQAQVTTDTNYQVILCYHKSIL